MKRNQINVRALAAHCGVSRSTVSRALRGDAGVSTQTGDRIKEAAAELGYAKDPLVAYAMARISQVKRYESNVSIAVLHLASRNSRQAEFRRNRVVRELIALAADARGMRIDSVWLDHLNARGTNAEAVLASRGHDGALVVNIYDPEEGSLLPRSLTGQMPCVAIGDKIPVRGQAIVVKHDDAASLRLAISRCREFGYRRLGLALLQGSPEHMRIKEEVFGAYLSEQDERDRVPVLKANPFSLGHMCKKWLIDENPDCIIVDHVSIYSSLATSLPSAFRVGFCDLTWSSDESQGLAGVEVLRKASTEVAIDLLLQQFRGSQWNALPEEITLNLAGRWRDGESLPLK